MKSSYLFLLFLLYGYIAQAQDSLTIEGFVKNKAFKQVQLVRFGMQESIVSSSQLNNGQLLMKLSNKLEKGVYRLYFLSKGQNAQLDVIINGEPSIRFRWEDELPVFVNSPENQGYYSYLKTEYGYYQRLGMLRELMGKYPDSADGLIATARKVYEQYYQKHQVLYKQFLASSKHSWANRLVKNRPMVFGAISREGQLSQNTPKDFWQEINATDTLLLHTPYYTDMLMAYFDRQLQQLQGKSDEQKTELLKAVADTVISKFSSNTKLKRFATDFLVEGFTQVGHQDIVQYIDEQYRATDQCEMSDKEKQELKKRLGQYQTLKKGSEAPRIAWQSENGKVTDLKDVAADTVVVVFWASWCPHCTEMMPRLRALTTTKRNIRVVAISLDDKEADWDKFINDYPSFIHLCDFKKWESTDAKNYMVSSTPTFYVLDKERKVIEKTSSVEYLTKILDKTR